MNKKELVQSEELAYSPKIYQTTNGLLIRMLQSLDVFPLNHIIYGVLFKALLFRMKLKILLRELQTK